MAHCGPPGGSTVFLPAFFADKYLVIRLTRLNQVPLVVNSDLIEHVEITPDTVIALTTGQKILVRETADEIIERVVGFRRAVLAGLAASQALVSPPNPQAVAGLARRAPMEEERDGEE
jgi:flagellar protein FlbD